MPEQDPAEKMAAPRNLSSRIAQLAAAAGLESTISFEERGLGEGWSAVLAVAAAKLELDLSRDGFVATISEPGRARAEIDEPDTWGAFYPEEKKIDFYLRVFRAYLDGRIEGRLDSRKNL